RNGHTRVRSSPLVPGADPTLLFTNAGMVQFKAIFLGEERRDDVRATTCQKCVRAGGKHNDLENVGRTARHHTFFEMLGNFSFGDYFKAEAVAYCWELLTREWGLPKDRLKATVFTDDDEAFSLWKTVAGMADDRILRLGEKDNFWAMGDTGPGLERIAAVVQGKSSNYDTDLLRPLIAHVERRARRRYGVEEEHDVSMRVIADHARAATFLIADGVTPSNEWRGYVLRRIMRRAMRHGRLLGLSEPFLWRTVEWVVRLMGDAYPELLTEAPRVEETVKTEEERFAETLDTGMRLIEEYDEAQRRRGSRGLTSPRVLDGRFLFRLYDTHGFPRDLAEEIFRDKGWVVTDGTEAAYEAEMEAQRERA